MNKKSAHSIKDKVGMISLCLKKIDMVGKSKCLR